MKKYLIIITILLCCSFRTDNYYKGYTDGYKDGVEYGVKVGVDQTMIQIKQLIDSGKLIVNNK